MLCQHGRQTSFKILCPFTFFVINNSFSLPSSNLPDVIFVLMHCFLIFFCLFFHGSFFYIFYCHLPPLSWARKFPLKKDLLQCFSPITAPSSQLVAATVVTLIPGDCRIFINILNYTCSQKQNMIRLMAKGSGKLIRTAEQVHVMPSIKHIHF